MPRDATSERRGLESGCRLLPQRAVPRAARPSRPLAEPTRPTEPTHVLAVRGVDELPEANWAGSTGAGREVRAVTLESPDPSTSVMPRSPLRGTGSYGAVLGDVLEEVGYRVVEAPTPRRERGHPGEAPRPLALVPLLSTAPALTTRRNWHQSCHTPPSPDRSSAPRRPRRRRCGRARGRCQALRRLHPPPAARAWRAGCPATTAA